MEIIVFESSLVTALEPHLEEVLNRTLDAE
jgi:hypothetical protein